MTPMGRNILIQDIFEFLDRKLLPRQNGSHKGGSVLTSSAQSR